ncbi:MAG: outer membrane beta-barrel protein [Pseudomonadota bacterium]
MKNANLVKCIAAVATASALGMPASASASDWFEPSAGIVSYEDFQDRWTGFYIGAHAGYGWLDTDDPIEGKIENTESGLGGGFLGYGYQANWLTFGGEVDFSISGFERDRVPGFASGLNADFLGSARARVGAAFDAFHVYATGGLFLGHVRLESATTTIVSETNQFGYVYGAGLEYAINPDWTVGLEGLRHELFEDEYRLATTFTATGNIEVVRARFSYQF